MPVGNSSNKVGYYMRRFFPFLLLIAIVLCGSFFLAVDYALAQACPSGRVCLKNPLEIINVSQPGDLVAKVFIGFSMMIAVFAIAFTVFSGFKLIIATNEESIKNAREGIKWSIGGFALSLLAFTVISGVAKFLGFAPGQVNLSDDTTIKNPILLPGDTTGLGKSANFVDVMNFLMVNFLGILGFVTILMIVYYGFRYITAAGNEETLEQAKTGLKWAIAGFVVTILAFTIISIVRKFLLQGPPA